MNKVNSMDEIIAKMSLSMEITSVALNCAHCQSTVKELIRSYKRQNTENHQVGGPSTETNRLTEHVIKNGITPQYK